MENSGLLRGLHTLRHVEYCTGVLLQHFLVGSSTSEGVCLSVCLSVCPLPSGHMLIAAGPPLCTGDSVVGSSVGRSH